MIKNFLFVFMGGGAGAALRYVSYLVLPGQQFPWATWLVNILGSLLMGIILGWSAKDNFINDEMRLLLATGFCGGFTTFSAFSIENLALFQQGKILIALVYIISSVVLAVMAAWLGFKLVN